MTDNAPSTTETPSTTGHEAALLAALQRYWGYDSFRPLQKDSMLAAMQSQDSLTVLPTGGGKSLCYQAPAVCRDGLTIVISPLIALMKDQVDALTACGVSAACMNSSLSTAERQVVANQIRRKEIKLLFAAPERLLQQRTLSFLEDCDVSFIAIDEAHCISNWGHDFRPEYRNLNQLRQHFPDASLHAFTATATPQVRTDIVKQLGLTDAAVMVGNFDRPNLFYRVERREDEIDQVRSVIDRHPNESGIVYCISRKKVEQMAATLKTLGYRTIPYHAGLSTDMRRRHQESFIEEKADIVVATVAFGMGIDKSNVRYVVHAEMPSSIEAYQQESGRAGRDGLQAECCLLFSGRDTATWEFLIEQSENEANQQQQKEALKKMQSFCYAPVCRHRQLVRHFGQELGSDTCGACDVCLEEVDVLDDALVVAQKILSSVYRQQQRFGADYTAKVLRGSRDRRILQNKHDQLSTYGLLKDESDTQVRTWIDQLVAEGFLRRAGEYSVLQISPEGGQVLKGATTPRLTRAKDIKRKASAVKDDWEGVDRGLFEALRVLRLRLAEEKGLPPYVIFGDMTLRELSKYRPTTSEKLMTIYGIGEQKREQFGDIFIAAILKYASENEVETNVAGTAAATAKPTQKPKLSASSGPYFELFDEGLSRDEVAQQLDRTVSTVSNHLERYIQARRIDNASAFLDPTLIERVSEAIASCGTERLRPIFEHLGESVAYEDIRIVVACHKVNENE